MANQSDVAKMAEKKPELKPIEKMIKQSILTLGEALPKHMNSERLVRIALTTLRVNPSLYSCTPESFMGALFQSAQLGLEPNIEGQAYIIPFKNNRKKPDGSWHSVPEAQFQIGYKGYVELFYRHQNSISLDMQKVCLNDKFDYSLGTTPFISHKPAMQDRGEVIGYYAVAKMAHGAVVFKFMSKDECLEHGITHSKCYDKNKGEFYKNTPWAKSFDSMCLKTVLIQLMKLLPKSIEIQKAISADETIKTQIAPDMLGLKDEANWDEQAVDVPLEEPQKEKDPGDYPDPEVDPPPPDDSDPKDEFYQGEVGGS